MTRKEDYQHIAVELSIDNSYSKLAIFNLTNLINKKDKYKADPKLVSHNLIY